MEREIKYTATLVDNLSPGAKKAVSKTQDELKKVEKGAESAGAGFSKLGGMITAAFSVAAIVKFSKTALDAYDKQVKAQAELRRALGYNTDALEKQAAALQKVTLYGDEETIAAQARMAAFIKDDRIISQLIPKVQDLAAAKGMDLLSAADMVTKSISGEVNALGRLGISLDGAKTQSEKVAAVTKGLEQAFGGAAEEAAKAGTGGLTQMKNAMGDLAEMAGEVLAPAMNKMARGLTSVAEKVQKFFKVDFSEIEKEYEDLFEIVKKADNLKRDEAIAKQQAEEERKRLEAEKKAAAERYEARMQALEKQEQLDNAAELKRRERARKADEWQRQKDSEELKAMLEMQEKRAGVEREVRLALASEEDRELELARERFEARKALLGEDVENERLYQQEILDIKTQAWEREVQAREAAVQAQIQVGNQLLGHIGDVSTIMQGIAGKNIHLARVEAMARMGVALANATAVPFPANLPWLAQVATGYSTLRTMKAAKGADFVTDGPQLLMVGENAGGRERVTVTPQNSPNVDGPSGGGVTINIHGNATPATARILANEARQFARTMREAQRRGYVR